MFTILRPSRLRLSLFFALYCLSAISAENVANYGNFTCHNGHPRCDQRSEYRYHQFGFQKDIGDFAGVSDVLPADKKDLLHYQSFLAELLSYNPNTNAVAFWGDAASLTDKGRVWGGFLSARSGLKAAEDSQLIGLEIDVLNGGKAGRAPNASKVGLQIVGFGEVNSNAIEILTQSKSSGQFMNAINVAENTLAVDGTLLGVGHQFATRGIDLQGSKFSDAAILLSPENKIVFRQNGTADAAIYRDNIDNGHLVISAGPAGFRVTNAESSKNILNISNTGWIDTSSLVYRNYRNLLAAIAVFVISATALNIILYFRIRRMFKSLQG